MIESRNKSPIMRGMTSRSPAKKWEDALITGNGTMGALVFGQPLNETIIFNHEKLYEPFNETVVQNNELTPILPEVRRQMKNGRFRDAAALFSEKSGHPLLFTDAYHPAFGLNWNQANSGKYRNYSRQVNFETGETIVKWANEAAMFERYGFVSRAKGLFVMRMTTSQPGLLSGLFTIDPLLLESSAAGYVEVNENELCYSCAYSKTEKGYVGRVKIVTDGKTTLVHDEKNSIRVQGATEVMVFAKITPLLKVNTEHEVAHAQLKADLASVASYSYDELVDEHAHIHGEQFARTALTLGEAPLYSGATEDLLVKKEKEIDEQLVQLMFDMGRYVLISSSGSYPPNLVGLWSGEWRPPWSGDFTTDANVNLAISSASLGCLPEALESYFHLIEKIVPDWRINARTMYGCRGILAGSRTDGNHNIHTHFDVDWPLGFWTAGAAWLIMPYYEWYQISGDDAFFRNRALPLLKEVALFYEDFLTEEDDQGYAMFIPSYSPENTPVISSELQEQGWQESQAAINATMDIACAKEVLMNLLTTCNELGIEQENIPRWEALLKKLPPYLINEEGALKEWAHPHLADQYDHRHISHLYPVWPGHEISKWGNPEWFNAAKLALFNRKRGNESAHGVMHCGIVAARLKLKELVAENLKFLLHDGDYIYSSLVTSHNPGRRIYNVDASCSLPTLIMEMLVYSVPGKIELLPALPDQLTTGSITGLATRTAVTILRLEWNLADKTVSICCQSHKNQTFSISMRETIKAFTTKTEATDINVEKDGSLLLTVAESEQITLQLYF